MDCSTPGLPIHHQLLEFTQTHVHLFGEAIQPSHPLSSLSPPAFNLSQHQGLFQGVGSSQQVLEFQLQHRCAEHGDGWYLPAIEELKLLLLNDDVYDAVNTQIESLRKRKLFLKGRSRCSYWSSTAEDPSFCEYGAFRAWILYMGSVDALCWSRFDKYYVRAVSAF